MTSYPAKPETPEEEQAYLVETLTKTIDRTLNGDPHIKRGPGSIGFVLLVLVPKDDDSGENCYLTLNLRQDDAIESLETAMEALSQAMERMRPN